MRKRIVVLASFVLLAACGGKEDSGLSVTGAGAVSMPGTVVMNHLTGDPMAGITLSVNDKQHVTDQQGIVVNGEGNPVMLLASAEVRADDVNGFLKFRHAVGTIEPFAGPGRIGLWPGDPGYLAELVYGNFEGRLYRPSGGMYTYGFGASIMAGGALEQARTHWNLVSQEVSAKTLGKVQLVEGDYESANLKIDINPADPNFAGGATALFYPQTSGFVNTGGQIVFKSLSVMLSPVALHETGHWLGLGHSGTTGDIMVSRKPLPNHMTFSPSESDAIVMMHNRVPGNWYQDATIGGGEVGAAGLEARPTPRWPVSFRTGDVIVD